MNRLALVISLLVSFSVFSRAQSVTEKAFEAYFHLLDSADAVFRDYMGYTRSNPIYEAIVPEILRTLNDSTVSMSNRARLLRRLYKSQENFAMGLHYELGHISSITRPIAEKIFQRGITYIYQDEDSPPPPKRFIPDNALFLKNAQSLGDSVLSSYLQIVNAEQSQQLAISIVLKCEEFLNQFPATYYSTSVWNKYALHTSVLLSNLQVYTTDLGPDDPCTRHLHGVEHNELYLRKFPRGLIAPLVERNLRLLHSVQSEFCAENDSYKRQRMIRNLSH